MLIRYMHSPPLTIVAAQLNWTETLLGFLPLALFLLVLYFIFRWQLKFPVAKLPRYDKNWIWLCGTMEAFREEHGRWPTRVHLPPSIFANLQEHLLTPEDFARVTAKVSLIPDGGGIIFAEDDTGATCAGFPKKHSEPCAADWFGVRSQTLTRPRFG